MSYLTTYEDPTYDEYGQPPAHEGWGDVAEVCEDIPWEDWQLGEWA